MGQWTALEHPNIASFLGLSYEAPFPAALVLPYYSNGNAHDYLKRVRATESPIVVHTTVLHLVRTVFLFNVVTG